MHNRDMNPPAGDHNQSRRSGDGAGRRATGQWTNSWFGRVLLTGFGALCIGFAAGLGINHEGRGGLDWVTTALALTMVGVFVVACAWTSKLFIENGDIVARHFFGTRRMELAKVIDVDAGTFFGLVLKDLDGRKMWTLISGRQWDELWLTRAQRICTAIMGYAETARRQQGLPPAGSDGAAMRHSASFDRCERAYRLAWTDANGSLTSTEKLLREAFKTEHVPGAYTEPEPALITLWVDAWRLGRKPDDAAAWVRAALTSAP